MYLSRWGLKCSPFAGPDATFFYPSSTHEEALARLHFLADQHRRLGLLLGESGVGKSLILDLFAGQLSASAWMVLKVNLLGINPQELLWDLGSQAGLNPRVDSGSFQLWRQLIDQLRENRYEQRNTALLLDDAEEAHAEVLQHVARLAVADVSPESRLTIVLASHRRRVGHLGRRLLELTELRIDLDSWDEAETRGYIERSLAHAGCSESLFTYDALARVHQLAGGNPRRTKQLADLALVAGAGRELGHIDAETVEGVFQELGITVAQTR